MSGSIIILKCKVNVVHKDWLNLHCWFDITYRLMNFNIDVCPLNCYCPWYLLFYIFFFRCDRLSRSEITPRFGNRNNSLAMWATFPTPIFLLFLAFLPSIFSSPGRTFFITYFFDRKQFRYSENASNYGINISLCFDVALGDSGFFRLQCIRLL